MAENVNKAPKIPSEIEKFVESGKKLREDASYNKTLEGSASADLEFCYAIGGKKQARVVNGVSTSSYKPIGYAFKAIKPIEVPDAPLTTPNDAYTVNLETVGKKQVKAGEEFQLNLVETAMLLSRIEFGGSASAAGRVVTLSGTINKDSVSGDIRPCLKQQEGSIKDGMVNAATESQVESQAFGKGTITEYTVLPQFEAKFGVFFAKREKATTDGVKDNTQNAKNWAAAFRGLYASKGVQI